MLTAFHPIVARWFEGRFGTPTEPQILGWPRIQAGEDTLICAPTGSGKTLAAFLACLDRMIREGASGRLEELCATRPVRIGLSATQRPVEEIARFLVGAARVGEDGAPRCAIVDVGRGRQLDVGIEVPGTDLSAVASKEQRDEVCDRVAQLAREHATTLVFVNTRRQVERIAHALGERLGEDQVCAHHGSLSRGMRLAAEEKLKRAEVKAVVATASLELGIDIGAVELVIQLDSPRSLSVALQRIGRAAHTRHGVPKARLFPLSRDQLVECAALVRGARAGRLEETRIPAHPLDVLAQQIVAIAACEEISEEALYDLVCRAWPYRSLSRGDFDAVIEMHAEGVAKRAGRLVGARLHRDGIARLVSGRRGLRLAAMTSGGAIPDTAQYQVVAEPEGVVIGQLHEDFAIESLAGDGFLLGNDSWRIRRVEAGRVRVENAHGAAPTVPFWNGEAPGRTAELSLVVSELRGEIEPMLDDPAAAAAWAMRECCLGESGAEQLVSYL